MKIIKRQAPVLEQIFAKYVSDKGLVSRIYKQLSKLKYRKKKYKPISKWTKDLNRHLTKEDTWMTDEVHEGTLSVISH